MRCPFYLESEDRERCEKCKERDKCEIVTSFEDYSYEEERE